MQCALQNVFLVYFCQNIYICYDAKSDLPSLFLQCLCELLFLCYSLFISTCSKIILISWLCIPARRCTSITWNLTLQEEVVIMAELLILDLNFKRNPVMRKICTQCWCSFLHHVRLFQWYIWHAVWTLSQPPLSERKFMYGDVHVTFAEAYFEHPFLIYYLFEFGSVYLVN